MAKSDKHLMQTYKVIVTYLIAMAAQRTAPELLFAVPEARQFRTAVHAEMLANCTRTHAHNQLVTHTLQKIKNIYRQTT